jgi:pSer/pThr/pTyr-binding forkhead associated (FHA) protein
MTTVTFQVLEGIDRGRIFRDLPTPVTIGREEGNLLRLNDERVSRFHAKVQQDNDDIILTDLESTNGTRVNGKAVQIRRLRPGDRILVGRSLLLFGSPEEIWARKATLAGQSQLGSQVEGAGAEVSQLPATMQANPNLGTFEPDLDFNLSIKDKNDVRRTADGLFIRNQPLPPLPLKMTPAQAARIAEIFDLLHRGLSSATENIEANEDGTQIQLTFADWQKVLAVQMLLAVYQRAVTDPDSLNQ